MIWNKYSLKAKRPDIYQAILREGQNQAYAEYRADPINSTLGKAHADIIENIRVTLLCNNFFGKQLNNTLSAVEASLKNSVPPAPVSATKTDKKPNDYKNIKPTPEEVRRADLW